MNSSEVGSRANAPRSRSSGQSAKRSMTGAFESPPGNALSSAAKANGPEVCLSSSTTAVGCTVNFSCALGVASVVASSSAMVTSAGPGTPLARSASRISRTMLAYPRCTPFGRCRGPCSGSTCRLRKGSEWPLISRLAEACRR
ncbi:hypothetical protein D3C76_1017390 [compost metagenome]